MGLLDGVNSLQGLQGFQGANGITGSLTDLQNVAMKSLGNVGEKLGDFGESAAGTLKGGVTQVRNMMGDGGPSDVEAGGKPEEMQQQTMAEEFGEIMNLTWTQRLILFLMTFAAGGVMIALAIMFLPLIVVKPAKFALSFTFGNILAIVSTWFLVGPRAQIRAMFDPVRSWAAALYVGSLVVTILACFLNSKIRYILILAAVITEVFALVWYAMSFIPYARQVVSRIVGAIWGGSISV